MIIPIVTCKGRLQHLTQTLPLLVEQFDKVVLVDYDCPDKCGMYAGQISRVLVEYVVGAKLFHKTHALNIGAERAMAEGATRLLFIDADTQVTSGLWAMIHQIPSDRMIITGPKTFGHTSLLGFLGVSVDNFCKVEGFNERYIGWGYEDQDMRLRLYCDAGCKPHHIPEHHFVAIRHNNSLRHQFQTEGLKESALRNQTLYRHALRARLSHWSTELKECLPYK